MKSLIANYKWGIIYDKNQVGRRQKWSQDNCRMNTPDSPKKERKKEKEKKETIS